MSEHQKTSCISRITMLINYGDPFHTYHQDKLVNTYHNSVYCSGIFLNPRDYAKNIKRLKVVVIDFKHEFAASIFRENTAHLTDVAVDIEEFHGRKILRFLPEALSEAQNTFQKIHLLDSTFTTYLTMMKLVANPLFEEIANTINLKLGNISVKQISDEICLSERTIRRKVTETN